MEHRSSLSLSQNPATFPYPEPDRCPHFDFLKSHINIILPSTPGSSELSLSLRFPYQNPVYLLPMRATWPTHLILLYFITRTIFGEEYRSVSFSLCSFLHSPVTSSLLGSHTLLITLFSYNHSLRSFLSASNKFAHPYKTLYYYITIYCTIVVYGADGARWRSG